MVETNPITAKANQIMAVCGQPYLTSAEKQVLPTTYTIEGIYKALTYVLNARKSPQLAFDKLAAEALLDNYKLSSDLKQNESNILIGGVID